MMTRVRSLLYKEFIQFSRDPIIIGMVLYFYTICVMICAYALTFDIKGLPFTVVDMDQSPSSRQMIQHFSASDAFQLKQTAANQNVAERWLENGTVRLALVVPEGFERALRRGDETEVQLLLDGANSNTADFARGYATQIIQSFQQDVAERTAAPVAAIVPVVRFWYNATQSFTSFMVLSMIASNTLMVAMVHPAASFVREKERGTLEQLAVSPIGAVELYVAKTIPTLAMGLLAVFPSLLIVWLFDVPLQGCLVLYLILTGIFLLSAIGLGVFVATLSKTLQQALLLAFFFLFPLMFLSGSLSPIESMPVPLQYLSLLSPLRHYMDVILGVFLKGAGIRDLWPQALALAAIGTALYLTSLVGFRRTVA